MLLWKTQVMNFITWALNSDSTVALFKSSQQGTVWTLPRPVRNTGSYKIQTKIRRAHGAENEERRIFVCGYATSAAWTAERRTPRPEHACSHPSPRDSFRVTPTDAQAGTCAPTPRHLRGAAAGLTLRSSPCPPTFTHRPMEEGAEHHHLSLPCPGQSAPFDPSLLLPSSALDTFSPFGLKL